MSVWDSYENLAYETFYWLAYTKICTDKNCSLYGVPQCTCASQVCIIISIQACGGSVTRARAAVRGQRQTNGHVHAAGCQGRPQTPRGVLPEGGPGERGQDDC